MDKLQEGMNVKQLRHSDSNNNNVAISKESILNQTISNKVMPSISKLNDIPQFCNDHFHNSTTAVNSVIQQSRNPKSISLQNLYNSVPNNHEYVAGPAKSSSSCENNANAQLVQILKPFYNSMQILQDKPTLISSDNSALNVIDSENRKLNIVDPQNQLSLLTQPNESYVHSLSALNSELLSQKKSSDFAYQSVNYHNDPCSAPTSSSYFNGYNHQSEVCTNSDSHQVHPNPISSNRELLAKVNHIKNLSEHVIAQNSSSDTTLGTNSGTSTGHTRGRKKTKKGPFICVECHKEFCNQSTLTKHMITHSDERKFVCPQCSKAFKRHDHLNGHMLTHREHKPYACDIEGCDKSYCDARSLRRHKEKHKENAFQNTEASLSHKLPALLSPEKGNNIYLPIHASAHLQFLALQQKKAHPSSSDQDHGSENVVQNDKEIPNIDKNLFESDNCSNNTNKLMATNSLHQPHNNALLHQLLTSQEKTLFNSNRQSIIKLNDNYVNVCSEASENFSQLFHPDKNSGKEFQKKNITRTENNDMTKMIDNVKGENNNFLECSICMKKFETITDLNAHVRLHAEDPRTSYLFQKSFLTNDTMAKETDLSQNSHPPNLFNEFNVKNYELEMNKNFSYIEQQKPFEEINMFDKSNDIEFRNIFPNSSQQQQQNHSFGSSLPLLASEEQNGKHIMSSNHQSIYAEQLYDDKNNQNIVDQQEANYQEVDSSNLSQTKGLNEVMFSPITPVTPMKNNTQFTFELSNQPSEKQEVNQEQSNKMDCLDMCKNSDQINYVSQLSNDLAGNFCFEPEPKNEDLLPKNTLEIDQSTPSNFRHHPMNDNTQINEFTDHGNVGKSFNSVNSNHEFFEETKEESTFNSFDFPSNKLTSDLFNRRAQKNAEINKTRELLSIKQIAASLKSFGQNYERNQQNQHINHSYSVPTTPCVSSTPVSANHESSSYPIHNLSHHSLPTTPVEGTHFTFKTNNTSSIYPEVNSMPNTPIENHHPQPQQQQFNFIFPSETQSNQDINSRNFDINCLNDSNYSEFIYSDSKADANEFVENIEYKQSTDSIPSFNQITDISPVEQSVQLPVEDIDENVNFYDTTPAMEYVTNGTSETNCQPIINDNPILNSYITPIKDQTTDINDHTNENPSSKSTLNCLVKSNNDHQQIQMKNEFLIKDINDNYVFQNEECSIEDSRKSIVNENEKFPPRIRSPTFVKSLNKKLSSINGASTQLCLKKKKPRPEPLYIPPHVSTFVYHSRLRSPRLWSVSKIETHNISPPPYTPPPMLSPVRSGSGLFWKLNNKSYAPCLSSNTSKFFNKKISIVETKDIVEAELKTPTTAYEPEYECYDIPQTDIQPHVNIGSSFQARIPTFNSNRSKMQSKSDKAVLFWDPSVLNKISDENLDRYLKISYSMCVSGGGSNIEYALHLLYLCKGDILEALGKLVDSNFSLDADHPLSSYYYADHALWTQSEIDLFEKSILKYDKDFFLIAKQVKTKSVKECIEFYYLWKKNSIDNVKRLRILRRKRDSVFYDYNESNKNKAMKELQNDCDENLDDQLSDSISKSNTTNGHCTNANKTSNKAVSCKKCGRTFRNLKSRSAHMKIHCN